MAIHASIVKVTPDGKSADMIQCLLSGGLDYTGQMLYSYYQDPEKVDQLIRMGMVENLGTHLEIVPGPFWKSTYIHRPRYSVHFADYEELHQLIKNGTGVLALAEVDPEAIDVSFCYVMLPDEEGNYSWYVKTWEDEGDYYPLATALEKYEAEHPDN